MESEIALGKDTDLSKSRTDVKCSCIIIFPIISRYGCALKSISEKKHGFDFFRTLSEFWHWLVANVPGDSVDDGDVIFDLLFPLVLPEGDGDHR